MNREIALLHDEVTRAVHAITQPRCITITRENGQQERTWIDSLLHQLSEAVAVGTSRSGMRRGLTNEPVSLAALDLWCEIDQQWRSDGRSLVHSLNALPVALSAVTDRHKLIETVRQLDATAHAITELFDPPRRYTLWDRDGKVAPCPECGKRVVYRRDATGDTVRQAALTVNGDTGCRCLACGAHWPPAHLEHLALVLSS